MQVDDNKLNSLQKAGLDMANGATGTAGAVQDQFQGETRNPVFVPYGQHRDWQGRHCRQCGRGHRPDRRRPGLSPRSYKNLRHEKPESASKSLSGFLKESGATMNSSMVYKNKKPLLLFLTPAFIFMILYLYYPFSAQHL